MEITVTIPDELAARARSSGLAPNVFVERLLAKIAQVAQQSFERDAFREQLASDWADFQANGLHLKQEEVDGWLAALERGENPELPELHA